VNGGRNNKKTAVQGDDDISGTDLIIKSVGEF
jgi:hypothetical protein